MNNVIEKEEKYRELLEKCEEPRIMNLYLRALAGFSFLEYLYKIEDSVFPQTDDIILKIDTHQQKQIIDNIKLITDIIDYALPEKHKDISFQVCEAFSCNLWLHEFLNSNDWKNLKINKDEFVKDLFELIFTDFEGKGIIDARHEFLPYDSPWMKTSAPLVEPQCNQREFESKVHAEFVKYLKKDHGHIPKGSHFLDFVTNTKKRKGVNLVNMNSGPEPLFRNMTYFNLTIRIFAKLRDYQKRLFYVNFKKFRLYEEFRIFSEKEKDNPLYKDIQHAFFVYELERATFLSTMFMMRPADLNCMYNYLIDSPIGGLYNLVLQKPESVEEFAEKMETQFSLKHDESKIEPEERLVNSVAPKAINTSLSQTKTAMVTHKNKSTDKPIDKLVNTFSNTKIIDDHNSKKDFYIKSGSKMMCSTSDCVQNYILSGRPVRENTRRESKTFFTEWNKGRKVREVLYFIDHAELMNEELFEWLDIISDNASTADKPTSFWLVNHREDGWKNTVLFDDSYNKLSEDRSPEVTEALRHLYPLFHFDRKIATVVLHYFEMKMTDQLWHAIISSQEPLSRTFMRDWYYIIKDERIEQEISPIALQKLPNKLINEIVDYLTEQLCNKKMPSNFKDNVNELLFDIPSYWFEKKTIRAGVGAYFELFAQALKDWDQDLLKILPIYGYRYKKHIDSYFSIKYDGLVLGYKKFEDIVKSLENDDCFHTEASNITPAIELVKALRKYIKNKEVKAGLLRSCGHLLNRINRYDEANKFYWQSIRLVPNNPQDWICLSKIDLKSRKYTSAIEKCRKAIEIDSKCLEAYATLVLIYETLEDWQAQVETYKLIAKEFSDSKYKAYACLSALFHAKEDFTNAIKYCRKAIKANSDCYELYEFLCHIFSDKKDYDQQIVTLKTITQKFKDRLGGAQAKIALAYFNQGNSRKAMTTCAITIKKFPDLLDGYAVKAAMLHEQKRYDEEIKTHKYIAKKFKNHTEEAYSNISKAYIVKGDLDKAISQLNKAIALYPYHSKLYFELLIILNAKGKTMESIDVCQKIADKFSELRAVAFFNAGQICLNQAAKERQKYKFYVKKAKAFFDLALLTENISVADDTTVDIYSRIAENYRVLGMSTKSLEIYNKIAENCSKHKYRAILGIAKTSTADNNYTIAFEYCQDAIKMKPNKIDGYAVLAHLYNVKGEKQKELQVHKKIARKFEDKKVEAYRIIASRYIEDNKYAFAKRYLLKAAELSKDKEDIIIEIIKVELAQRGISQLPDDYHDKAMVLDQAVTYLMTVFPENNLLKSLKADILDVLNKQKDAFKIRNNLLKKGYRNANVLLHLGQYYTKKRNYSKAEKLLKEASEFDTNDQHIVAALMANELQKREIELPENKHKRWKMILQINKYLLSILPGNLRLRYDNILCRIVLGHNRMAIDKATKLLEEYSENERFVSLAIRAYAGAAKVETKKIKSLERAIDKSNSTPRDLYNLACAYSLLRRPKDMYWALSLTINFDEDYKKIAKEDEDFKNYWRSPKFKKLTKELKAVEEI
ncbi:MAG: TPR end-of-group domain-containing protein [Sedimentisphaeraceae bacterium JB056]